MKFNDAVSGAVLLVLSLAIVAYAQTFPPMPGQRVGPSLYPTLAACGLGISAIILIVRGVRARVSVPWAALEAWAFEPRRLARLALVLAAMPFYLLASEPLGFVVTSFVILFVLMAAGSVKPWKALPIAAIATLGVDYMFGSILRVPLPRGIFETWWW
jgi:putative tricarboxylic transport membrane protein